MASRIVVETGSRLHFGPLAVRPAAGRRFGGLGLMIDQPRYRIEFEEATTTSIPIDHEQQFSSILDRLGRIGLECPPGRFTVDKAIPAHRGFGSGTQLALAISAIAAAVNQERRWTLTEVCHATGRGMRSGIGIEGFRKGGFLIDAGHADDDSPATIVSRIDFPEDWRYVIVVPCREVGTSGENERQAFDQLPAMPREQTAELCRIALMELWPAIIEVDFAAAARALEGYGSLAGDYFAPVQGGRFSSKSMSALAAKLHDQGWRGIVQSSWGPSIAVLCEGSAHAAAMRQWIHENSACAIETIIASPRNSGAAMTIGDQQFQANAFFA